MRLGYLHVMAEPRYLWRQLTSKQRVELPAIFAPREQFHALLGRELTPEVTRFGHDVKIAEPHKCGTPNFAVRRFGVPRSRGQGLEFRL